MKAWRIILILICLAGAGIANGVMDTLQFHYPNSRFAKLSKEQQLYWNPAISWENKYEKNLDGSLVQPLRAAFPGSVTVLSFITDGWHLMKFFYTNLVRVAFVLILSAYWKPRVGGSFLKLLFWIGVWGVAFTVQSAGFHLMYTIIL